MTQRFVIRVKQLLQGREVVKSFKMNFQNLYIHLQLFHLFDQTPARKISAAASNSISFRNETQESVVHPWQ